VYNYEDETYAVVGGGPSRPESPALEIEAGRAIERAFRSLVEDKYLYQKQEVDLSEMEKPVADSVLKAAIRRGAPRMDGSGPFGPEPQKVTPERFKELCREVAARPWILGTRHVGDSENERLITHHSRGYMGPLETPVPEMNLGFLLPSVQLQCLGSCKSEKTFMALVTSKGNPYSQPWGLIKSSETEQLFFPIFRCVGCSKFAYTMLVKRKGLKLHLCGMSPRRPAKPTGYLPEALAPIYSDAEQSIAEGDIFAAIYHLRTLIEHYVKGRLGLAPKEKRNGDDLIAQYNSTIVEGLRGTLPSLLSSWQTLSEALHAREGKPEDYTKHRDAVCKHIQVVATLGDEALVPSST
jgi:hypothetical protein